MREVLDLPSNSKIVVVGNPLSEPLNNLPAIIRVTSLEDCPSDIDVLVVNPFTSFSFSEVSNFLDREKPKFIITGFKTVFPKLEEPTLYRSLLLSLGYRVDVEKHFKVREFLQLKVTSFRKEFSTPEDLVSICIPAFNGERTISEALESVLLQEGVNFEVIVVDDCSSDGTFSIVEAAQNSTLPPLCSHFKCIRLSHTQGAPTARNEAWKNSVGNYILFFDCDDLMHPLLAQNFLKTLKNSDDCYAFTYPKWWKFRYGTLQFYRPMPGIPREPVVNFEESDKVLEELKEVYPNPVELPVLLKGSDNSVWRKAQQSFPNDYLGGSHFQSTSLVRRKVLEEVGGWPEDALYSQDRAFFGRISKHGYKGIPTEDSYFVYTAMTGINSISITRLGKNRRKARRVLEREGAIPKGDILLVSSDTPWDFSSWFRSRNLTTFFNHTVYKLRKSERFEDMWQDYSKFIFLNPVSAQSKEWIKFLESKGRATLVDYTVWLPEGVETSSSFTTTADRKLKRLVPNSEFVDLTSGTTIPIEYIQRDRSNKSGIGWLGSHYSELEESALVLRGLCTSHNTFVNIVGDKPPSRLPFSYRFTPWEEGEELSVDALRILAESSLMVVGNSPLSLHFGLRQHIGHSLGVPVVAMVGKWVEKVGRLLRNPEDCEKESLKGLRASGEVISQPLQFTKLVNNLLQGV